MKYSSRRTFQSCSEVSPQHDGILPEYSKLMVISYPPQAMKVLTVAAFPPAGSGLAARLKTSSRCGRTRTRRRLTTTVSTRKRCGGASLSSGPRGKTACRLGKRPMGAVHVAAIRRVFLEMLFRGLARSRARSSRVSGLAPCLQGGTTAVNAPIGVNDSLAAQIDAQHKYNYCVPMDLPTCCFVISIVMWKEMSNGAHSGVIKGKSCMHPQGAFL